MSTVADEATIARIAAAIRAGLSRADAARAAGMRPDALRRHVTVAKMMTEDERPVSHAVYRAICDAERDLQAEMLSTIARDAKSPDGWRAAAWILERRFPKEWSARVQHHVVDALDDFVVALKAQLPEHTEKVDAAIASIVGSDTGHHDASGDGQGHSRH